MNNPIKKLLGQTAVYGLSSIVGRLLNYLLVPLYTHAKYGFKDPADYGVVSELYAWVAFLVVLLTFGMETAFFRFIQQKDDKEKVFRNAFLTVLGVNVLFFATLLFFNQNIANALLFSEHNEYVIILAAVVCIDAISALPLAKLRAENKAFQFVGVQFSSILTNVLLNVVLLVFVFDPSRPEEGVLFILFSNLIASLVKPVLLYKHFLLVRFSMDVALAKEMVVYAFPLVIAGFAGIVNETIDRILLKHLLYDGATEASLRMAESQVGIYSASYKLAMLVTILIQAYRYAAEPFFFAQMNNQEKDKIYVKVMNFFIATVCLVFLVVSLNLDFFKLFIRSESYYVGLSVVPILLLANVFLGIYYNQSIWYKLSGQTKYGAYIAISGAVLTVLINVIFIPVYGFMACAWATLIVYAFQLVLSYKLGQKYYPIKYNLRKFGVYLGTALLIFWLTNTLDLAENSWSKWTIHNGMIVLFVALIYRMEKTSLKNLFVKTEKEIAR
jgi:O-antigen/teichoic acid export membrane protein